MDTIIPVTLSARHVKAAERLAHEQESDMTPATYIESVVLHVLRGRELHPLLARRIHELGALHQQHERAGHGHV